jgi:hypothetical protein
MGVKNGGFSHRFRNSLVVTALLSHLSRTQPKHVLAGGTVAHSTEGW